MPEEEDESDESSEVVSGVASHYTPRASTQRQKDIQKMLMDASKGEEEEDESDDDDESSDFSL